MNTDSNHSNAAAAGSRSDASAAHSHSNAPAAGLSAEALSALLRERLQTLQPMALEIIDESHLHVGHAGARGGARHFRVNLVSKQFDGLRTLARHRLVYDCVRDLMPHPVHALAITADTSST